jgi:hypothetical protein
MPHRMQILGTPIAVRLAGKKIVEDQNSRIELESL